MRVLVTGGAGFIGSHLVTRLLGDGHDVRVLDDLSTGKRENLAHLAAADVELVVGDVRDGATVDACARGCEVVFHEAAIVSVPYSVEHPQTSHDVNLQGTLNVLLAARAQGVRRVVFACSAAVYGDEPTLPKREDMAASPISPYGIEKIAGEQYVLAWPKLYGVEGVSLRYFNVFGPRQDPRSPYSGVISVFVDRARAGREITVFGDGEQSRDFVFVEDVVQANVLAATVPSASGRAYNIGRGARTTLNELLAMLERIVDRPLAVRHEPPRAGDIRDSLADVSRAREELGFAPRVAIEEGLRRLIGG
ncbi:MAG: SDR family oxidoreductase [Deltaproteobacteria bacterium]|nr:SDR family oxidoreductase [Deltaproteobacteria bacterium]